MINFSSSIILLFILIALPLINLRISLLEDSNFDNIIKSIMFIFFCRSVVLILIEGKLDPSEFSENASLAVCCET